MCILFARRGEDFVGLLRVCASLPALQSNVTALTQEVQELIGRVESHVFHFQARQEFLEEGLNTELVQGLAFETMRNGMPGRRVHKITEMQIWSIRSVGFTWRKIAKRAFGLGTLYTRLCKVLNRRNARLTGSTLLIHSRTLYLCTRRPRPLRAPITIR